MKVYIGSIPAGSSRTQPYITLDDPPYIPRKGDKISVLDDPVIHTVKSVCFNIALDNSITVELEDQNNI